MYGEQEKYETLSIVYSNLRSLLLLCTTWDRQAVDYSFQNSSLINFINRCQQPFAFTSYCSTHEAMSDDFCRQKIIENLTGVFGNRSQSCFQ